MLIARCSQMLKGNSIVPLSGAMKARILSDNSRLAEKALRVLAVAYKDTPKLSREDRETESELIFCGLIGMELSLIHIYLCKRPFLLLCNQKL